VVLAKGVTLTGVPLNDPGIQANVVPDTALLALRETLFPMQAVVGAAAGVTTGVGFMVIT